MNIIDAVVRNPGEVRTTLAQDLEDGIVPHFKAPIADFAHRFVHPVRDADMDRVNNAWQVLDSFPNFCTDLRERIDLSAHGGSLTYAFILTAESYVWECTRVNEFMIRREENPKVRLFYERFEAVSYTHLRAHET